MERVLIASSVLPNKSIPPQPPGPAPLKLWCKNQSFLLDAKHPISRLRPLFAAERKQEVSPARAAPRRRFLSLLEAVSSSQPTPETLRITGIVAFARRASGSGRHADVDIDKLRPPKHHCGGITPPPCTTAPSRLKITGQSMKTL